LFGNKIPISLVSLVVALRQVVSRVVYFFGEVLVLQGLHASEYIHTVEYKFSPSCKILAFLGHLDLTINRGASRTRLRTLFLVRGECICGSPMLCALHTAVGGRTRVAHHNAHWFQPPGMRLWSTHSARSARRPDASVAAMVWLQGFARDHVHFTRYARTGTSLPLSFSRCQSNGVPRS